MLPVVAENRSGRNKLLLGHATGSGRSKLLLDHASWLYQICITNAS